MGRFAAAALLIICATWVTGCSNPKGVPVEHYGYYSPVDSTWKVIHNFQLAYVTKNIEEYMNCFHEEFEFILLEVDWGNYGLDSLYCESWGIEIEEEFTEAMFTSPAAEIIELTFTGDSETIWYGDSTGKTMQLVRAFDLKVYYFDEDLTQQGWRAQGDAIFLCKPDENGEYRIWKWTDLSEI